MKENSKKKHTPLLFYIKKNQISQMIIEHHDHTSYTQKTEKWGLPDQTK